MASQVLVMLVKFLIDGIFFSELVLLLFDKRADLSQILIQTIGICYSVLLAVVLTCLDVATRLTGTWMFNEKFEMVSIGVTPWITFGVIYETQVRMERTLDGELDRVRSKMIWTDCYIGS